MNTNVGYAQVDLIQEIITETWKDQPKKEFTKEELFFVLSTYFKLISKKEVSYKSGNRGHSDFRNFVKLLLYRNALDLDSMLLLSAPKGGGKSSASISIAREWCRLLGKRFDFNKSIVYSNAQLMKAIDEAEKFGVIIADEAVRFALGAEWAKTENKELKKKLAQIRTKHLLFILCWPLKVNQVEKTYLDSFVNYWVEIYTRGRAIVFIKDNNPVHDAWRLKDFDLVGSYNEFTDTEQVIAAFKKHPNFWMEMGIPKVPSDIYASYKLVRDSNVFNDAVVSQTITEEDLYRSLLILVLRDIMTNNTNITITAVIKEIQQRYGISVNKGALQSIITDAEQLFKKHKEITAQ